MEINPYRIETSEQLIEVEKLKGNIRKNQAAKIGWMTLGVAAGATIGLGSAFLLQRYGNGAGPEIMISGAVGVATTVLYTSYKASDCNQIIRESKSKLKELLNYQQ